VICEKCWSEAETRGMESKTDAYRTILKERRDHPCTPPEQAGGWWDEENQRDRRLHDSPIAERRLGE